jgi:hypothetical protein
MASSLLRKLRIQPGQRLLILNAPPGYVESLGELPEGVEAHEEAQTTYDFVHLFVKNSRQYGELGPAALGAVVYNGLLWISYPKRSSKVETDLTRDVLWKLVEKSGLRPVTQVSINEVWSAMRFRPIEAVKSRK